MRSPAVRHDAGEGHRLLHAAYERDGSLGPIQALNSFTKSHRDSWSRLRDRLPVQLTDVRDQVSSVFDAIDEEVGPLRSLLPATPDGKHPHKEAPRYHRHRIGSPRTTGSFGSESASGKHGSGGHAPRPSASPSKDDGLLGGDTGGLLALPSKGGSP